jgi:hypothetical protein
MFFNCQKHGSQFGVIISPDLYEMITKGENISDFIEVFLMINNDVYHAPYLSLKFLQKNNLNYQNNEKVQLSKNNQPKWIDDLVPICIKCFDEKANIYDEKRYI